MKALVGLFVLFGAMVGGVFLYLFGTNGWTVTGAIFWASSSTFLLLRYFSEEVRTGSRQEEERRLQLNPWDIQRWGE